MKTAVETIFVGKDRQYNRRILQMCSHHLVEPVACTPASGWEKGQVENQVGLVRERFFTPRLRFKTFDELNAWLMDKCIAYAKAHAHPERADRTVWEVFEEERPRLIPYRGRFDGFHALPASVSKTCLVRFDNNKYSVNAGAVGRPVEIHAYADRIVIRQDGRIVAEHARCFGRRRPSVGLDEIHNVLAASWRDQRVVFNTLRYLSNELKLSLVCFGIMEARQAINGDVQLARRFDSISLPRWIADKEFEQLVLAIVRNLPLKEPSVLTAKGLRRILLVSGGVSARIFRMLNDVAIEAIETGVERITDEALERYKPVGEDEAAFQ